MIRIYTEMSFKKAKVEDFVSSLARTINLHLIMIFMIKDPEILKQFSNDDYIKVWSDEVVNRFTEIGETTIKGKLYLNPKRYFELLFLEPLADDNKKTNVENFTGKVGSVIRIAERKLQKSGIKANVSVETVVEKLQYFYNYITKEIPILGLGIDEAVEQTIPNIIKKWKDL